MVTETLRFRVTPALKEAVERAARDDRRSVSDWLRLRIEDALNGAKGGEKWKQTGSR